MINTAWVDQNLDITTAALTDLDRREWQRLVGHDIFYVIAYYGLVCRSIRDNVPMMLTRCQLAQYLLQFESRLLNPVSTGVPLFAFCEEEHK